MSEAEPLITYLATHDAPCPGCEANLRGQDEPYCPKCLRDLYLGEVETWHSVFGDARGKTVGPSRGAILEAMITQLETSKFSCVGCGYQLQGIKAPRCPECARSIRPLEVIQKRATPLGIATQITLMLAMFAALLALLVAMNP